MKIKLFCRFAAAFLAVIMTACAAVSCAPPKLEEVKDVFVELIEGSAEINQILFGDGLSVYGDISYDEESKTYYTVYYTKADGKLLAYYDKDKGDYLVLRFGKADEGDPIYVNEEKRTYLYATDLVYVDGADGLPKEPADYKFVRLDERFSSMSDIADAASRVYSEDYLADVFEVTMGSLVKDDVVADEIFVAKYMEILDSENEKKYLVRAKTDVCPPITTEERIYDYDSMTIAKGSRKSFVTVEIRSYGTYVDLDAGKVRVGWSTTKISFVNQNGEWRLDSPTY